MELRKKILIIDDDQDSLSILEDVFIFSDFTTKGIPQTHDIFSLINDFRPDLVLIDYLLPGINGGELCSQIKSNAHTAHLPVVLISAYPRVLESLGRYGCDAFIAKPFNIDELISCVNDCLHTTA